MTSAVEVDTRTEWERGRLRTAREVKNFATAGNATLTLVSCATGARYTYKVRAPEESRGSAIWFVSLMTGPDNDRSFQYLGQIRCDMTYEHGWRSSIGEDAPGAVAFAWFWAHVVRSERDELMSKVEVWHEGRCGRCGRKLTVPSSVASGFGPDCVEIMNGGGR
jgi:hypothetical protein